MACFVAGDKVRFFHKEDNNYYVWNKSWGGIRYSTDFCLIISFINQMLSYIQISLTNV